MNNNTEQPLYDELPSHFANRLGIAYASSVNQEHKKINGQFFTPIEIAVFMASYSEYKGASVRILDPGCGTAILSCALIEHLFKSNKGLKSIELVAYEMDAELISSTRQSLNYLQKWGLANDLVITIKLYTEDFIMHNADCLKDSDLFAISIEPFDIVISNPPYFKLSIDDKRTMAAKVVVNGHPNIYSIFMAVSAKLLKENGELIIITPRSYAAGGYFKTFRKYFFNIIDLIKAHLFVSRKDTFGKDNVLQETVIIKGIRKNNSKSNSHVIISSTSGIKDLSAPLIKSFPKKDIIDLHSNEKILYLPTTDFEETVLGIFKSWSGNLAKYNIKISTGPVVAFRTLDHIIESSDDGKEPLAPLYWLHNVKQMVLEWPIVKPGKGQYIKINGKSRSVLIPNKNYILLRRFSSKDDKNRLIAAPYFCNYIDSDYIGVENKVNYIYRPEGQLERSEIIGLCALLNSNLFDVYFRIFNGNVNVSATELRDMALPPLETIKSIGNCIMLSNDFSVENANSVMNKYSEPVYTA
jgi:adenine-specific DNA-methyltransferase